MPSLVKCTANGNNVAALPVVRMFLIFGHTSTTLRSEEIWPQGELYPVQAERQRPLPRSDFSDWSIQQPTLERMREPTLQPKSGYARCVDGTPTEPKAERTKNIHTINRQFLTDHSSGRTTETLEGSSLLGLFQTIKKSSDQIFQK